MSAPNNEHSNRKLIKSDIEQINKLYDNLNAHSDYKYLIHKSLIKKMNYNDIIFNAYDAVDYISDYDDAILITAHYDKTGILHKIQNIVNVFEHIFTDIFEYKLTNKILIYNLSTNNFYQNISLELVSIQFLINLTVYICGVVIDVIQGLEYDDYVLLYLEEVITMTTNNEIYIKIDDFIILPTSIPNQHISYIKFSHSNGYNHIHFYTI
jgi:hypothetical protein